tara:strand:- start:53 stop:346 length:294 start_codon:yes stop_codon:yes gene_type:complete
MKVEEFYNMLPREFWNKVKGFNDLEEMRQRSDWLRTRWSTCLLLNIHMGKGKSLKPRDLVIFDWEREEIKENVDFKGLKQRAEYIKKLEEIKNKDGK